jgi:hypothetical protein
LVVWFVCGVVQPRRGGLRRPPVGNREQDSCNRREQGTRNGGTSGVWARSSCDEESELAKTKGE